MNRLFVKLTPISWELCVIKTIAPGAIATNFTGRSLDKSSHIEYQELEEKLFGNVDEMMNVASAPEQIAGIIFETATDGKDQIRYIAGTDAENMFQTRTQIGGKEFRKLIRKQFVGH